MRVSILSATLLFALTALTLIILRPLMPIDETRYLAAAWEMHQGGSLIVPHLNGALYAHKPPLLFWLINLVWKAVGVDEFAARLVAPAFAVCAVALTGVLGRQLWPQQRARSGAAALILAVSPLFLLFGSTTMFDAMLTVTTLLAMLALWDAATRPRMAIWVALGAAIALGVYAKGPVILIHVLPVALAMPLWAGPGRPDARTWYKGLGLSILVALVLVGLWLLPAIILGGGVYRSEVLWRQSGGRMVGSFAHQRPVWFYLALLPLLAWPFGWTATGLACLTPRALAAQPATRFLAVWFGAGVIAFSFISGKQMHYLLPELPALALLLSGGLPQRRWLRRDLWLALPLAALMAVIIAVGTGYVPALDRMGYAVPVWALAGGTACLLVGIAGFLQLRVAPVALAGLPLALMIGLHVTASPLLFDRYDLSALGGAVAPHDATGIAVTDGTYHAQLNFAARLQEPVAVLSGSGQIAAWRQAHPHGVLLDQTGDPVAGMTPVTRLPYQGDAYTLHLSPEVAP